MRWTPLTPLTSLLGICSVLKASARTGPARLSLWPARSAPTQPPSRLSRLISSSSISSRPIPCVPFPRMSVARPRPAPSAFAVPKSLPALRHYQHWYSKPTNPLKARYLRLKYRFVQLNFAQVSYGLIAVFVAVYAVKSLIPHFPPLYFVTGFNSPWYTPVTCLFDHASVPHIFSNSIFLFCLASVFPYGITATATMAIFFVGGWTGLAMSELLEQYNAKKTGKRYYRMVSGSSAAIYALCAVQTFIDPFGRVALYGIIPMRNYMFLAGVVGLELYGVLSSQSKSIRGVAKEPVSIDHMAHLGGVIAGALCYVAMRRFRPFRRGFDF